MAVLAIFSSAVLIGVSSAFAAQRSEAVSDDAKMLSLMVENFIRNELGTAADGSVVIDGGDLQTVKYKVGGRDFEISVDENGRLMTSGAPAFSDAVYSDVYVPELKISTLRYSLSEDCISVTLEISDWEGRAVAASKRQFSIGLINY